MTRFLAAYPLVNLSASRVIRLCKGIVAGNPIPHLTQFHEILTNITRRPPLRENGWSECVGERRRLQLGVSAFFREDLVKWCEPWMSQVCYHCRRGAEAGVPFPFFCRRQRIALSGDSWTEPRSQRKGERRAALHI